MATYMATYYAVSCCSYYLHIQKILWVKLLHCFTSYTKLCKASKICILHEFFRIEKKDFYMEKVPRNTVKQTYHLRNFLVFSINNNAPPKNGHEKSTSKRDAFFLLMCKL